MVNLTKRSLGQGFRGFYLPRQTHNRKKYALAKNKFGN
jgi:hypothetical protein